MTPHQFQALVIDDEAGIREKFARLLEEYDFIVETAGYGEEALEKLLTDKFDVAIVDLKMPHSKEEYDKKVTYDKEGLEILRQADAAGIDTYAVILTGVGQKDDAIEALRLQNTVKEWFDKPINDYDVFVQRIKEVAEGVPLSEVSRILSKLPLSIEV